MALNECGTHKTPSSTINKIQRGTEPRQYTLIFVRSANVRAECNANANNKSQTKCAPSNAENHRKEQSANKLLPAISTALTHTCPALSNGIHITFGPIDCVCFRHLYFINLHFVSLDLYRLAGWCVRFWCSRAFSLDLTWIGLFMVAVVAAF